MALCSPNCILDVKAGDYSRSCLRRRARMLASSSDALLAGKSALLPRLAFCALAFAYLLHTRRARLLVVTGKGAQRDR